jgi:TPP-dependent pyruvate/acetoin dehydrogenase alpha subunit
MTLSLEQAELTLSPDAALDLYRTVRLIRRFEETVQTLFLRGEVHGTTHLYIGQEAVATGVGSALRPEERRAAIAAYEAAR